MNQYTEDTNFACTTLIKAISHQENELTGLAAKIQAETQQLKSLIEAINFHALNPDLDNEGLTQLKSIEANDKNNEIQVLQERIRDHERSIADKAFSATALCGSLLQIAKQGLSLKFGQVGN